MSGRALPAQKPGRAQHEGAGANGSDEARPLRLRADEGERRVVLHERVDPRSAREAEDVELRTVGERYIRLEHETGR